MKKLYFITIITFLLFSAQSVQAQPKISNFKVSDSCFAQSINPFGINYGVSINQPGTTLTLVIYFGDGTSKTVSANAQWVSGGHNYLIAGIYTVKFVLLNNNIPVDSALTNYNVFCSIINIKIYGDNNTNCAYDPSEPLIGGSFSVEVDSNGSKVDTITVWGAALYRPYGTGTYKFKLLNTVLGISATCPSSPVITVNVPTSFTTSSIDFGLQCGSSGQFDLAADVNGRFRPTNNSYIDVYASNMACGSKNATLVLQIDPKYSYSTASVTPANVSGNTITWNLSNLSVTQSAHIFVTVTAATSVSLGDTICNIVTISPSAGDVNSLNNTKTKCNTVVSAFDPNDKSVTPEGDIKAGTTLTYNINFENLGNDTAFNIYILDTLSVTLDPGTLEVLSSSHPMTYSIQSGVGSMKIARFDFQDIKLEDKNVPTRNKGAVMFSIKTKSNLGPATQIPNRAGIYFDVNPVVMTNTASNRIEPVGIKKLAKDGNVSVYPNPVKDVLIISMKDEGYNSVKLINNIGQTVLVKQLQGKETTVSTSQLSPGIYFIILSGESGIKTSKIEKL